MKILILVLSCLENPFDLLMKKQQETWDSIPNENIKTIYYYGNGGGFKKINETIYEYGAESSDEYEFMHWKFFLLLKEIINDDWDYIFRTNSSSYVDKENLLKFAKTLPKEKCYCGINVDHFYASGCGFFLSRDVVEVLLNSNYSSDKQSYEDMYIGHLLYHNGIGVTPGATRSDLDIGDFGDSNTYHYRCRSYTDITRELNLLRFDELFKKIT
jgi:hypothetical protein